MERKFNSISEEGKALVMEFMATVKGEVERKEIVAYVKEHISDKEKLSDGTMAGVIKMLTTSGELVVVSRGRYKKGIKLESLSVREKVLTLFHNFQRDLNKAATISVINVTKEDIEFCQKVSEISNEIESRLWALEDDTDVSETPEKAEPVKDTEKVEPVKATEKAEPAKGTEKVEPVKATEKAEPVKGTEKVETVKATEKAKPAKATEKAEPAKAKAKVEANKATPV